MCPWLRSQLRGYEFPHAGQAGQIPVRLSSVNIVGDKTQKGGMATCGYDDDGVKTTEFANHQERPVR